MLVFLTVLERERWTQERLAQMCRVSTKSIQRWSQGRDVTSGACLTIADGLERHFAAEGVRVTPEDVAQPDLVGKIRSQLEERGATMAKENAFAYSERNLRKLLDDAGVVRLLGIDGPLREWLLGMVPQMRADLTDQDWAEVVRIVKAGLWEVEGYLFMDPDVISVRMHFKSPRLITDAEKRKLQQVLQRELDKLWADKHNPGA